MSEASRALIESQSQETRYKSFAQLVLMVLNICMSPFYFGYGIAYFGTFDYKVIREIFKVTLKDDVAEGLLQGCVPIGAGLGALGSFLVLKYFSRK